MSGRMQEDAEREALEARVQVARKNLEACTAGHKNLSARVRELEDELTKRDRITTERLDALDAEWKDRLQSMDLHSACHKREERLRKAYDEAEASYERTYTRVQGHVESLAAYDRLLREAEARVKELESELTHQHYGDSPQHVSTESQQALYDERDRLKAENELLRGTVVDREERLEELEGELQFAHSENEWLRVQNEDLRKAHIRNYNENVRLLAEVEHYQRTSDERTRDMHTAQAENERLLREVGHCSYRKCPIQKDVFNA